MVFLEKQPQLTKTFDIVKSSASQAFFICIHSFLPVLAVYVFLSQPSSPSESSLADFLTFIILLTVCLRQGRLFLWHPPNYSSFYPLPNSKAISVFLSICYSCISLPGTKIGSSQSSIRGAALLQWNGLCDCRGRWGQSTIQGAGQEKRQTGILGPGLNISL